MAANNQYLLNKEIQKWYEKKFNEQNIPKREEFF